MFYRNRYVIKPTGAIWSDGSVASTILNNEFWGVPTPPSGGLILAIGGAGTGGARINGSGGLAIIDGTI